MRKIKKGLLTIILAVSILGWMYPKLRASAAPANHVHEWGSYRWLVEEYFVFDKIYLFSYESNGHIYEMYEVTKYGRYYEECYCGAREYNVGGVVIKERILVE